MLQIWLFGDPQIQVGGQPVELVRRKSRALVYYLAAQDDAARREQLLPLFWPDLDRQAAQQTLRTSLHGLKKALGAGLWLTNERVGLAAEVWVDRREFTRQLGSAADPAVMDAALALYRGEFLQGFSLPGVQTFEDWLTVEREHYRRQAVRGLAALAQTYEQRGDYQAALASLDRALSFNPLQEDLQRESMRLLYLAGNRPGAVQRYDDLRRLLDEQMGVPPMVETRALYDAIITDRLPARRETRPTIAPLKPASQPRRPAAEADELPFSGRVEELRQLTAGLKSGKLVLVDGEPGIGKTRLIDEFLRGQPALPLVGRGRELEQSLPYHPLIEALRSLLARPEWLAWQSSLAAELPAVWQAEIGRLLPETLAPAGQPVSAVPPADEARLWEGVRQFLEAVARRRPLLFFWDDIQWLDASTLALVGYLVRHMRSAPVGFLAASRPLALRSPAARWLQGLVREGRLEQIHLGRLGPAEIQAVAAQLCPRDAAQFAEWLARISEGNPYILNELVREARQQNLLTADGLLDQRNLALATPVPRTVYSMIQSRLAGLSDPARRVLDAAVAVGREFDFDVAAGAAGLSESGALDALDELLLAGLVMPTGDLLYSFDHSLTMEVAYREVGEARHRLLHRRVAETMEKLYLNRLEGTDAAGLPPGESAGELAGRLVGHFIEGGAPQRAARYALQAGRQAAALAAWSEAAAFYEQALTGLSGEARLPVLEKLGEVYGRAGHFSKASETLRTALALALTLPHPQPTADELRLALSRNLIPQARYQEVIDLAQEVCGSGSPETAMAAQMLWGTALSLEGSELATAQEHLETAREIGESTPGRDISLLSQTYFELGNVAAQQGDLPLAIQRYRRALEILSFGDLAQTGYTQEQRVLTHNNLAYHLHLLGSPEADEHARLGLELAEQRGMLGLQTYLYSTRGEIALAGGQFDQAERYFQKGLELAERFSVSERVAGLTANLGRLAAQRGQPELAIHRLSTALGLADSLGVRHLGAQIRIWLAPLLPPEEARQRLAEARRTAETSQRRLLLAEIAELEAKI